MTPDELAAEGIRNLATAVIPMDEEGSDTCTRSFYSHATAPECLELAVELNDQGASAVEVLQLIGLPGIAFNAPRGVSVFVCCNVSEAQVKLMNFIVF